MIEAPTLAKNLRLSNERARLQLTQEQLADLAGVSRQVISNAENPGRGKAINRVNAFAILKVLNGIRDDLGLPPLDIDDLNWKLRGD